jgi:hypothetical protein
MEIYPGSYFGIYAMKVKYNFTVWNNYSTTTINQQGVL